MGTTHKLRKPVASRRALQQRQKTLALCVVLALGIAGALALLLIGCGGGSSAPVVPPPIPAVQALQMADVQKIVTAAVNSAPQNVVKTNYGAGGSGTNQWLKAWQISAKPALVRAEMCTAPGACSRSQAGGKSILFTTK